MDPITEGCPWDHEYCYEPQEIKVFRIPEIVRNDVKIMDMNLLCKSEALEVIRYLGNLRVNKRVIYYELICGLDFRFLTQDIAKELKTSRFKKIRMAWDGSYRDQLRIKDAIKILLNAGYKTREVGLFIICNWEIPYAENLMKLDLCKIWNIKVYDCYYDNQVSPHFISIYWSVDDMRAFRKKCRLHNQLVNFRMDPDWIRKDTRG